MAYLRSYQGDYARGYRYARGDPFLGGFFKKIGSIAKGAIGIVSKAGIPVVSGVAGAIGGVLAGKPKASPGYVPYTVPQQRAPGGSMLPPSGILPVPGVTGIVQRMVPGGATGYMYRKRRRMNPANAKALRRAIRRQESFVKLARKALKGTQYTIRTKGSGRRPSISIRESGPGGVSVRR